MATARTRSALAQLVASALASQGLGGHTFAAMTGIPAEQLDLVLAGRVPADVAMLDRIADRLGLDRRMLRDASGLDPGYPNSIPPTELQETDVTDPEQNLAQLAIEAVHTAGASMAAFARVHGIPYISLAQLIKTGEPPRRKSALDPLQKALGLNDDEFEAALEASRAQPTPGVTPEPAQDVTPLQAALLKVVADRKMTMKAFAEAADLSVLTAARLLKRGELPGRATTHEKLRNLLGLTEADYRRLLDDSRAAIDAMNATPTAARPVEDDEVLAPSASAHSGSPSTDELVELLDRLNPRQRTALKAFILTLV